MSLPRVYWCHADVTDSPWPPGPPADLVTQAPGQALTWMRESVRELTHRLDRPTFHLVWAWLGDHRGVEAAIRELRRGRPYGYAVVTPVGKWSWTARPVSTLSVPNVEEVRLLGPDDRGHERSSGTHLI